MSGGVSIDAVIRHWSRPFEIRYRHAKDKATEPDAEGSAAAAAAAAALERRSWLC